MNRTAIRFGLTFVAAALVAGAIRRLLPAPVVSGTGPERIVVAAPQTAAGRSLPDGNRESLRSWLSLTHLEYSVTELAAIGARLAAMDDPEFSAVAMRSAASGIVNRFVAAIVADRLAGMDPNAASRVLPRLENPGNAPVSGNASVLMAYAERHSLSASESLAKAPPGSAGLIVDRWRHVVVAFSSAATGQMGEALALARQAANPRRAFALCGVASAVAAGGDGAQALSLLAELTAGERWLVKTLELPDIDRIDPALVLQFPEPLPERVWLRALTRLTSADPSAGWEWVQSEGNHRKSVAQSFFFGLSQVTDPSPARRFVESLDAESGPVAVAYRRKVASSVAIAAARSFPLECADWIAGIPEGNLKRDTVSICASQLSAAPNDTVAALLSGSPADDPLAAKLIEFLAGSTPHRAVEIAGSVPPDVADAIEAKLPDRPAEEPQEP